MKIPQGGSPNSRVLTLIEERLIAAWVLFRIQRKSGGKRTSLMDAPISTSEVQSDM